jgi:hypothetical protein
MINNQEIFSGHQANVSNDFHNSSLDRLMHLWTSITNDYKDSPRSGSSSNSSSPVDSQKYHPLNLSISMNNNNLMCSE